MAQKSIKMSNELNLGVLDILNDFGAIFPGGSKMSIFRTLKCTFGVSGLRDLYRRSGQVHCCKNDRRNPNRQTLSWFFFRAGFLLAVVSFLLRVELSSLQLCLGAFLYHATEDYYRTRSSWGAKASGQANQIPVPRHSGMPEIALLLLPVGICGVSH